LPFEKASPSPDQASQLCSALLTTQHERAIGRKIQQRSGQLELPHPTPNQLQASTSSFKPHRINHLANSKQLNINFNSVFRGGFFLADICDVAELVIINNTV